MATTKSMAHPFTRKYIRFHIHGRRRPPPYLTGTVASPHRAHFQLPQLAVLSSTGSSGDGEEGARDAFPVPVLGPHQPDAEAGGAAARARGVRHLRQHGAQPRAAAAHGRRAARPRRVPVRGRPRRAAGGGPPEPGQDGASVPVAAAELRPAAGGAGACARGTRRRAARHLRRAQRPRQLRARRGPGDRRSRVRAVGHQRVRVRRHASAAGAPAAGVHAAQRRELPDERVLGHADRLDPRDAAGAARRHLELRPDAGPAMLRAAGGGGGSQQLRPGAGPHPQHVRGAGVRRPRRAPGRVPAGVHHRPPRRRHAPPRRGRRRGVGGGGAEPVGGGLRVRGVAGRAAGRVRPVRQLREPGRAVAGPAGGARVGPRRQRPPVPLGRPPRPRRRRPRRRCAAGGLPRGDRGPALHRRVVRAGAGAAAPRRGRVPDAQRLELYHGEHLVGRAHDLPARVRRPVHQLPVCVRGVGHRAAPRRAAAPGAGRGAHRGAHGRRRQGRGHAALRRQVEGGGRGRHGAGRVVVREPRLPRRGASAGGSGRRRRAGRGCARPGLTTRAAVVVAVTAYSCCPLDASVRAHAVSSLSAYLIPC